MNKFRLVALDLFSVRWPLRRPFITSLGAKSHTDNIIVKARLSGGAVGYGEASSSLAMPFQTVPKMAAALRRLFRAFRGEDVRNLKSAARRAWRLEGGWPTAVAAFEVAVWDAFAREARIPFSVLWGGATDRLETLLTVSVLPPDEVYSIVRAALRRGFRAFKLKLNGRDPGNRDAARIRQAHRAAPKARFLVDANQSYSPGLLGAFLDRAARDGIPIEVVEEPFPKRDWGSLKEFRGRSEVPVLLDESVQTPRDARRVRSQNLAQGVNVKLAKSGLLRGKDILDTFWEADPPRPRHRPAFMIGCMAESPLGLTASVHWAFGLGVFDYVDLDSDLLLAKTTARGYYVRRGPEIRLPRRLRSGLGVEGF